MHFSLGRLVHITGFSSVQDWFFFFPLTLFSADHRECLMMNTLPHGQYTHKTLFLSHQNLHTLLQSVLSVLTFQASAKPTYLILPKKRLKLDYVVVERQMYVDCMLQSSYDWFFRRHGRNTVGVVVLAFLNPLTFCLKRCWGNLVLVGLHCLCRMYLIAKTSP